MSIFARKLCIQQPVENCLFQTLLGNFFCQGSSANAAFTDLHLILPTHSGHCCYILLTLSRQQWDILVVQRLWIWS